MPDPRPLYGRKVIYCDAPEITADNIIEILDRVFPVHLTNRADIDYLYNYYKGNQPILYRTKEFNEGINNKIVENRANEIVAFKTGYLMGEPVQYVARRGERDEDDIAILNDMLFAEDKPCKDTELADWFHICGTSYRLVLPDPVAEEDDAPFEIYTLDPRDSFVIYWSGLGHKPLAGVTYTLLMDGTTVFSVYTPSLYMELKYTGLPGVANAPDQIVKVEPRIWGEVPLIEYPANSARQGAFEIVIPILDAMNTLESNRVDGVEQFIQSILVLSGTDLDSEQFQALKEQGGLLLPPDGNAKYLTSQLNQTQTQTLMDSAYEAVLTICGMPNRNGGSSTSDTGTAVVLRDGWTAAENRARTTEQMFKASERRFLKVLFEIVNTLRNKEFRPSQVDIRFTRRNYENIQVKSQVLVTMLQNDKIHPLLAFEHCGMFVDPMLAYEMSKEYSETASKSERDSIVKAIKEATEQSANEATDEEETSEEAKKVPDTENEGDAV